MENNRLLKILLLLLENKKTTAPELAQELEVSVRTVYRDIDRLSSAGIPVYTTTGKYGGIHLMDNYVMDKSLLNEDEQIEILLGLYSISAIPHLSSSQMLKRLTTLFDQKLDWIEFDHSPRGRGSFPAEEMDMFDFLKQAIFTGQPISFHYVDSNGHPSTEKVRAEKLIFKNNAWYFRGIRYHGQEGMQEETFKVKRITGLAFVTGTPDLNAATPYPVEEQHAAPQSPVQLKLQFAASIAYRVYDQIGSSMITEEPDGTLSVSMDNISEGELLYSFLMSFGADVTILGPQSVRETLLRKHVEAVEHLGLHRGTAES